MIRIVVMGHGGYADGIRQNIEMVVGPSDHMHYIDLKKEDDLAALENKVNCLLKDFKEDEVLFACDLLGASPFQVAAQICTNHPGRYYTVAGINSMALIELSMASDLSVEDLAYRAIETTKSSAVKFPE
jgi:PTS system N-acetylgalactosamine-specific IIA component